MASISLCIASDSGDSDGGEEAVDRGVNGLGGGDGLQPASVDDDFSSTIASECEPLRLAGVGFEAFEV